MQIFNKSISRQTKRKLLADERTKKLQEKIRRQCLNTARMNKILEKTPTMKKVCKHYPRKTNFLGFSRVNYDIC